MQSTTTETGVVLVLAATGKEGALATATLGQTGIAANLCFDLADLLARWNDSIGALVLGDETFARPGVSSLIKKLGQQPSWSELPVIILTNPTSGEDLGPSSILKGNSQLIRVDRPIVGATFLSVVQAALHSRRLQFELRDLLSQRETLLSGISDAFSVLDREWRYIYVNDRVVEQAGLPRTQMIGQNIWELFPKLIGSEFYERCHRALAEGRPDHFEHHHPQWGRWLETRVYPTADGLVIFRADISERKRQEEFLRESERKRQESEDRLRLALEATDAGTFDYYPNTGELSWSARCKELFGLPPDAEVTYETFLQALHSDDRARVEVEIERALQPGSSGRYEIEYRAIGLEDNRRRWIAAKGRVIFDLTGKAARFIGTVFDITRQKEYELELHRAKAELEEAARSKDHFLAMLSHELRTPLTPVLMTIAALRRDSSLSDELQRDLDVLQRNIELEALLIDDLLDLTRIAHGKLELHNGPANVHDLIEHAWKICEPDLREKKTVLVRKLHAKHFQVWGDAARLQQVFWNLLKNAIKFTPPGGKITISSRNHSGNQIEIDVTDNGSGIEPSRIPKIFEAFEQGGSEITRKFGGLGLGLAICKRVVDLHHGTIKAESRGIGHGATFTVTLTAMETSLLDGPAHLLESEQQTEVSGKILLVEDHEDTARVLRRILEKSGYHVIPASSVAGAREAAEKTQFDLVISDLGLPDGSGLELMDELRRQYGWRGIALSGFGSEQDVAASRLAGFSEHLTKPIAWEDLKSAIQRVTSRAR